MQQQQFEETGPAATPLVQQLESPSIARQQVDSLLAVLAEERRKRRIRRRWITGGLLAWIAFMLALAIFLKDFASLNSLGWMSGVISAAYAASQAQKRVTKELAEFEDIRSVGPLAEALEYQDRALKAIAEDKLKRLLPRLQASDAGLLDEEQRKCLYRALRGRDTNLILAVLKALEQIGDEQAVPFVQKLANGEGLAARYSGIREAAQECLPALQQRAERERSRQTLLRAASASDTPSDMLLRPASGALEADPQQLHRASGAEEHTDETRPGDETHEQAAVRRT
jgi:hypothetical protein